VTDISLTFDRVAGPLLGIDPAEESALARWETYVRALTAAEQQSALDSLRGRELIDLFVQRMVESEEVAVDAMLAVHEASVLSWLLGDETTMLVWLGDLSSASRLAPPNWSAGESIAAMLAKRKDLPAGARRAWSSIAGSFSQATLSAAPPIHSAASTLAGRVVHSLKPTLQSGTAWTLAFRLSVQPPKTTTARTEALGYATRFSRPSLATLAGQPPGQENEIRVPPQVPPPEYRVFMVSDKHRDGDEITADTAKPLEVAWELEEGESQVIVVVVLHTALPETATLANVLAHSETDAVAVHVTRPPNRSSK